MSSNFTEDERCKAYLMGVQTELAALRNRISRENPFSDDQGEKLSPHDRDAKAALTIAARIYLRLYPRKEKWRVARDKRRNHFTDNYVSAVVDLTEKGEKGLIQVLTKIAANSNLPKGDEWLRSFSSAHGNFEDVNEAINFLECATESLTKSIADIHKYNPYSLWAGIYDDVELPQAEDYFSLGVALRASANESRAIPYMTSYDNLVNVPIPLLFREEDPLLAATSWRLQDYISAKSWSWERTLMLNECKEEIIGKILHHYDLESLFGENYE